MPSLYEFHDADQRLFCEQWMEDGRLHCLDTFAYVEYDVNTGFPKRKECYVHGVLHSVNGLPSRQIFYPRSEQVMLEEWHANGKLSNFPFPSMICYAVDGEWTEQKHYRNGQLHRLLGATVTTRKFDLERQMYRISSLTCYMNGTPHSSHGPQRVRFNPVRTTYKNCFNGIEFRNRYNVLYAGLMQEKAAERFLNQYDVRKPTDIRGTECPICTKEFSTKIFSPKDILRIGAGVLLQCLKCKQAFHLRCVEMWDATCVQNGSPFTCSTCRVKTGTTPMRLTLAAQKQG